MPSWTGYRRRTERTNDIRPRTIWLQATPGSCLGYQSSIIGPACLSRNVSRESMPEGKQLSKRAQRVLLLANRESKRLHCPHVASEHLLLAALAYRSPGVSGALRSAGLALDTLRSYIAEIGSAPEEAPHGYGPSMHGALRRSYQHSEELSHCRIEPEHLVLGVLDETSGGAARALRHFAVDTQAAKRHIIRKLKK